MAGKLTGLGSSCIIDDSGGTPRTISNDVRSIELGTSMGEQEVTGIDKSAMERLLLIADGTIKLTGIFNVDVNMSHDVFKTVVSTRVQRTTAIGFPGPATLTFEALFSNYTVTRPDSGELTWVAEGKLSNGTAPAWT
jgi:hypothetical protein